MTELELGRFARLALPSTAVVGLLCVMPACTAPCSNGTWTWYGGGSVAVQFAETLKGKPTELAADGLVAADLPWDGSLADRTGGYAMLEDGTTAASSMYFASSVQVPGGTPAAGWSGGLLQASFWSSTRDMGSGAHTPTSDEQVQIVAGGASLTGDDSVSLDMVDATHATLEVDGATFSCPEGSYSVDTGPSCSWDGSGPLWVTVSWSLDDSVRVDQETTSCPQ